MEGNGYISDKTMGVNIHSCLAVTPEGLVLGLLDQTGFNRREPKNTSLTREQQKNRPIEGKEGNRRLETMENADGDIQAAIQVLHVCDREGYEVSDKGDTKRAVFSGTNSSEPDDGGERANTE